MTPAAPIAMPPAPPRSPELGALREQAAEMLAHGHEREVELRALLSTSAHMLSPDLSPEALRRVVETTVTAMREAIGRQRDALAMEMDALVQRAIARGVSKAPHDLERRQQAIAFLGLMQPPTPSQEEIAVRVAEIRSALHGVTSADD